MSNENIEPTGQGKPDTLSFTAIARRRILLQGVSKGAAVLAATVPIQTLAGQSLLTEGRLHQCSVSGQFSGVHSATLGTTQTCGGYSISYWGAGNGIPKYTWPIDHKISCNFYFKKPNLDDNVTLFDVMKVGGPYSSLDEVHWICAWLNALKGSFFFPYSAQQVLDYYNLNVADQKYIDALKFFSTYMESHIS